MPSLHTQAKKVFSVPHVVKNVWNHDLPAGFGQIPGGGSQSSHAGGDPASWGHIHVDNLCGAGADFNRGSENDFLTLAGGNAQAPGWWLDISCQMDQFGRLILLQQWELDNRGQVGNFFPGPATYPRDEVLDTWWVSADVPFIRGHLWITQSTVSWELHNDSGSATTYWAVEMKIKAGV